jgi:DNA polymerase-3 subunit gamma/tau
MERRLTATGVGDVVAAPTTADADEATPPAVTPRSDPPRSDPPRVDVAPEASVEPHVDTVASVTVAEPSAAADEPAPPPDMPASTGVLDVVALRRLWDGVLDAVKQRSRTAHALMFSSQIESLEGNTLTLSFPTPTLATRFANDVADFVVEALKEVVNVDLVLRTTSPSRPAAEPPAPPAGEAPSSDKTSPNKPSSAAPAAAAADLDPDEVDEAGDVDAPAPPDPADAALALLKKEVGAQVIGEIDRS